MYHQTQWSTTNVPAAGNVLSAWVSYLGWDSLATAGSNVTSHLNTQATATFNSATVIGFPTLTKTAGTQDLSLLGNVIASSIKGNYASSNASTTGISLTGTWTPATNTTWARFNLGMTQTFQGDPVVKIGDKVSYVAGWRWFATAAATTAVNQGQSTVQTWTVVDNAVALTVSGVAAIVALSF
jgi:hypothetical protein